MTESITTSAAPRPVGNYPHARRAGQWLFLSGVGPRSPEDGKIPGLELDPQGEIVSYDFAAQCHSVFRNVRAILEASGFDWQDLIDVVVFLTNMKRDFPTMNRIYAEYFAVNPPCRTTVEVGALPTPIAIELKCIAVLPQAEAAEPRKATCGVGSTTSEVGSQEA